MVGNLDDPLHARTRSGVSNQAKPAHWPARPATM